MIATCLRNRSAELPDHQRGRFLGIDERFALTVGVSYVVVGMGVWETVLHVLVQDDTHQPSWCPIGLFDCGVQRVPTSWEFALGEGIMASGRELWTRWIARWGYPELVRDPTHSDGLMERDPTALVIFSRELMRRERESQG